MAGTEFDARGWEALLNGKRTVKQDTIRAVQLNIRTVAFWTKANVQRRMPVDTGAARSSWGAPAEDGIWEFSDDGTTHEQGSKLPYIEALNEGHSRQAPAGFLDVEEERMITKFIDDMAKDLTDLWE